MPELLNKLLNNFDEEKNEHLMLKGELLRELERFDTAKEILKQVSSSEYLEAKEFILDLAENEESDLKKLNI
jgi:thermostable 8-oxoguanine DNA glycosylase